MKLPVFHSPRGLVLGFICSLATCAQATSAVEPEASGPRVLLVQEVRPWLQSANETILQELGLRYDIVDAHGLPAVRLARYQVIIIASDQPMQIYNALIPGQHAVARWLIRGAHTLQFHGADSGMQTGSWERLRLPAGVSRVGQRYAKLNRVVNPASPLVAGLPLEVRGNYASHTVFAHVPPGSVVMAAGRTGGPTLLDYCYGQGRVIASGQTLEIASYYGWDSAPLLRNITQAATQAPGCPGTQLLSKSNKQHFRG